MKNRRQHNRNQIGSRKSSKWTVLLRLALIVAIAGSLFFFLKHAIDSGTLTFFQQKNNGIGLNGQPNPSASSVPIKPHTLTSTPPVFSTTPTPLVNVPGLLHVQGNQLIDGSGHPVLLRGAHITSVFNYIVAWNHGAYPFGSLNPGVFSAMRSWGMNVLRIPLSFWIYQLSPSSFLSKLDTVIQEANSAGLYVVIDNHDDDQAGSPYGKGADVPKPETIAFWQAIASHYKYNPMILFDIINEPKQTDWNTWLHGGGTVTGATGKTAPVVGMQDVVNAIRAVGAPQIIIAESSTLVDGFSGIGNNLIQDPNIVYSIHEYFDYAKDNHNRTPSGWNAAFGNLSATHPVFIGEWAVLPNAQYPTFCNGLTTQQAEQLTLSFLQYMQQHQVNWTAWNFNPYHLIQDYTNYTPTTLTIPWSCGNTASHAGMGSIVKQFLAST
jgi:endoglucanase